MQKFLVLFLSTFAIRAVAETYSAGTTEVDVETTILDANNSTRKCVTYMSGKPEKYEIACFTSTFTDGGTFQECTLQFDNDAKKRCEVCAACTNSNEEVGFHLDCDSIIPSKSNLLENGACTVLNDANIQTVLTDETTFANVPFDFTLDMTNLVTDDSDKDKQNSTKMDDETSSSGTSVLYGVLIAAFVGVLGVNAL